MLPLRTILVPTDFSGSSANAFAVAASLAREGGARIILLHVVGEPTFAEGIGLVPVDQETYRSEMIDKLDQQAASCPGIRLERRLVEGKPVAEIVRGAHEFKCDLVVMGTHGASGLRRFLLGSVAEGVARKAPCPVITVRMSLPHEVPQPELVEAAAE